MATLLIPLGGRTTYVVGLGALSPLWLGVGLSLMVSGANAVPSFARQTGQNCVACHVSFPELTPYGRWFKLSGYTIGSRQAIPLAMMAQLGRTTIKNNDDGSGSAVTARDGQVALNGVSLFLAGKATDNIGGFVQWTYSQNYSTDGTSAGHSGIDNTDLRWVGRIDSADASDVKLLYGLTLHNNPTAQDAWNSTPAFGFPYTASPTAVGPTAATQIEGALGQQVAGIGVYGFHDKTWYGELTAYRTADGAFSFLRAGQDHATPGGVARLDGYNPYVRLAYNREWGPSSLMLGVFALRVARYVDNTDVTSGTDRFTDRGADAQYQYITSEHTFTAQARYVKEAQDYRSGFGQGLSSNARDDLSSINLKASYYLDHQYGITFNHFSQKGTADALLYPAAAVSGSANGKPDSRGNLFELDYAPLQNVRFMLQYTAYQKFNGGGAGYDGVTARRPRDNNTLFFNVWVAY